MNATLAYRPNGSARFRPSHRLTGDRAKIAAMLGWFVRNAYVLVKIPPTDGYARRAVVDGVTLYDSRTSKEIEVRNVADVVPAEMRYEESAEFLKTWCAANKATYYARPRECFNLDDAIGFAVLDGSEIVLVEDMS